MRKAIPELERFVPKITFSNNGCWLWTGSMAENGYGFFKRSNGRMDKAHRFAYEYFIGEIPNGLSVLHHCDIRRCVNPDHLWVGTAADNQADMTTKGRGRIGNRNGMYRRTLSQHVGERNVNAKLDAEKVKEIRHHWNNGVPGPTLARLYCVTHPTIYEIVHRRTWKHVT